MKATVCSAFLLLCVSALSQNPEGSGPPYFTGKKVNINVRVTDLNGNPVEMALIAGGREGRRLASKFTGKEGVARFEMVEQGYFHPVVLKNGYYRHFGAFNLRVDLPGVEREYLVRLKPVLDPVPIEIDKLEAVYPLSWQNATGIDLEKLDFVAPHGKGVVTDLVVKTTWHRVETAEDYRSGLVVTTVISLAGPNDALFVFDAPDVHELSKPGSVLMPPNVFPDNGLVRYTSYKTLYADNNDGILPTNRVMHVAFRVRTRLNQEGKAESAHVGWLRAPINTGLVIATGPDKRRYIGERKHFTPEWGLLEFTRHWNPNPKSLSLEPRGLRWENSLPYYIKTYNLEKLPGIETLQRLPRDHQDFRPTPEEEAEEIRRNLAERIHQKKLAKEQDAGLK